MARSWNTLLTCLSFVYITDALASGLVDLVVLGTVSV